LARRKRWPLIQPVFRFTSVTQVAREAGVAPYVIKARFDACCDLLADHFHKVDTVQSAIPDGVTVAKGPTPAPRKVPFRIGQQFAN
jgi:hypothetical protein